MILTKNFEKKELEIIRDALVTYHKNFMSWYSDQRADYINIRVTEQRIIKLRDEIDEELKEDKDIGTPVD